MIVPTVTNKKQKEVMRRIYLKRNFIGKIQGAMIRKLTGAIKKTHLTSFLLWWKYLSCSKDDLRKERKEKQQVKNCSCIILSSHSAILKSTWRKAHETPSSSGKLLCAYAHKSQETQIVKKHFFLITPHWLASGLVTEAVSRRCSSKKVF